MVGLGLICVRWSYKLHLTSYGSSYSVMRNVATSNFIGSADSEYPLDKYIYRVKERLYTEMKLYKAIKYDGASEKVLDSDLICEHENVNSWETLVKTVFSHISQGDKKGEKTKEKDAWISATYDLEVVKSYLNNKKYDFNCIAVIDLPNTPYMGYIYDDKLRKFGYIDKELSGSKEVLYSTGNEDGILAILDMSSPFTLMYLGTYLWLKGEKSSLGNFRANRNANKYKEVLILANNVKFRILGEDEEIVESTSKIKDVSANLFYNIGVSLMAQNMRSEDDLREFLKESLLANNIQPGGDWKVLFQQYCDMADISADKEERYTFIYNCFQNVRYEYQPNRERIYYYGNTYYYQDGRSCKIPSFHSLSKEDKDNVKQEYEIVIKHSNDITFDEIVGAYIYAAFYMGNKDNGKKEYKGFNMPLTSFATSLNWLSNSKYYNNGNIDEYLGRWSEE